MPEGLLDAESVALAYDEIEELNYYRDFGRLDDLFADPHLYATIAISPSDTGICATNRSRRWQSAASCSATPMAPIRSLALLRKPGFSWQRDGEKLLRRHKRPFFARESTPSISAIGKRLIELLRVSSASTRA